MVLAAKISDRRGAGFGYGYDGDRVGAKWTYVKDITSTFGRDPNL